jgi:hypothetical protein
MKGPNLYKFSWLEIFNDSKGRTSPGKIVGFFACVVSVLVFAIASLEAVFARNTNDQTTAILTTVSMQSVALFTVGSALLAIRRFTKDKEVSPESTA